MLFIDTASEFRFVRAGTRWRPRLPSKFKRCAAGQQLELEGTLDQYDIEQGSLVYCIEEAPKWLQATQSQQ